MNELLRKAIAGEAITDEDVAVELYEVCDRVHASCDDDCPVYARNGGPLGADKGYEVNQGCDCFKNGKAMLAFLRG